MSARRATRRRRCRHRHHRHRMSSCDRAFPCHTHNPAGKCIERTSTILEEGVNAPGGCANRGKILLPPRCRRAWFSHRFSGLLSLRYAASCLLLNRQRLSLSSHASSPLPPSPSHLCCFWCLRLRTRPYGVACLSSLALTGSGVRRSSPSGLRPHLSLELDLAKSTVRLLRSKMG